MAFTVSIHLGFELDVRAKADEVFAVLSDVPTSASFFPKVHRLVDLGGGAFRWEMEKIGIDALSIQTIYACRYASDAARGTVVWTPLEGVGNATVAGSWKIKSKKKATALTLDIQGALTLPLPALMQPVIAPAVEAEFEGLIEQYVHNLIPRFGGEV